MNTVFDILDPARIDVLRSFQEGTAWSPDERLKAFTAQFGEFSQMSEMMLKGASGHMARISATHGARAQASLDQLSDVVSSLTDPSRQRDIQTDWQAYARDFAERAILMADILRERGDIFLEHEAAGCPPVLIYDYEVVVDGKDLEMPCNYQLLRIVPPEDCDVHDWKRPYIIIDPRAGHGAGIGGFKPDSQVGVAIRDGHPVYFVSFGRDPMPGQSLAHVTRAEAEFVREVQRRHPDAALPVVTGNCQGGWATLILAATNPDITGPICLNGAPVVPWSGTVGKDPMRYNGGVLGGTWQPMFWSDVGHGVFDGANLVMNFELLNPGRTMFRKYYDLFAAPDRGGRERFLEFEKWWGGFFLLNEAEIRWIVEQLFIGNRLAKSEARLETGSQIDLKNIRAPIIVFASHGDNITPPQQALNWIIDNYTDVSEIQIRGQRIIYMVHEQVGHLGIFVSSKIAKKEHSEVASTLKTIEALPPGLYEMKIDDYEGEVENRVFSVSFHERKLDDIRALDDGRDDEAPFAAVARNSELQAELYDVAVRPLVQSMVTPYTAELGRALHPLRVQRAALSSRNPLVASVETIAKRVEANRLPVDGDNSFLQAEKLWAELIHQSLDMARDLRDAWYENMFFQVWGSPWMRWFGRTHLPRRVLKNEVELRMLPAVQAALRHKDKGGFAEAVVRMLIMLADSRGSVRRDRLERSSRVLTQDEPFRSLTPDARKMLIHEQTLIVEFDREGAVATLPALLTATPERELALKVVRYIPGAIDEMAPHTIEILQRFCRILDLAPVSEDVLEDPLADASRVWTTLDTAAE